jgi:hypothetical protein
MRYHRTVGHHDRSGVRPAISSCERPCSGHRGCAGSGPRGPASAPSPGGPASPAVRRTYPCDPRRSTAQRHRRIELRQKAVERLAQMTCPPYRLRPFRRRNGDTVFAQVAETLEQRIGAELVDLLRLAPKLSRCRYCGRIYVRRCGGFLARGTIKIEDCLGRPPTSAEWRERRAAQARLRRHRQQFGADSSRVRKEEREYEERWPPRSRGPKSLSGDDLLP